MHKVLCGFREEEIVSYWIVQGKSLEDIANGQSFLSLMLLQTLPPFAQLQNTVLDLVADQRYLKNKHKGKISLCHRVTKRVEATSIGKVVQEHQGINWR
jgi:hypothetical protein